MLVALGLRWLLTPLVGDGVPFITVFAAMMILLLSVRPLPFLVASVLGGLGVQVFFLAPRNSLALQGSAEYAAIMLFGLTVGAAALAAWLADRLHGRRRETEEELVRRGEELRVVTDAMPALISYVDNQFRYRFVNARYLEWFGTPAETMVGRTMREVLGDVAFGQVRSHAEAALAGRRCHYELEAAYTNGTRLIHAEYVPDVRSDGTVAGFYALVTDISEQRRAEAAQARLAAIVETSGDAILSVSLSGEILTWNAGAEQLFGHAAAEAVGRTMSLILPPGYQDEDRSIRERVQRGEVVGPYDTQRRTKDGRFIDVSVTASPIRDNTGRIIGASKLDRDITERKQAERALHESQRRLATLVGNLPGMAYRYLNQPGWPVEFVSERVCDIVGHEPQAFVSGQLSWTQLIHPEDLERVRSAITAGIRARRPWQIEYRVLHHDGSERWVWERGEPVVDASGELLALEGFVSDVSQRKQVEHELEASRARERSYLEHLPVGVFFANDKGEMIFANAAAHRIWGGVELAGPQGYNAYEGYWHGTDRRVAPEEWSLARALRGETSIAEELDIRTFDGQRKTILSSAVPVRDGDGTIIGAVIMNLDITEQKRAETALKHADRRKDEFLATLAHELRNPLAAIRTATELLVGRQSEQLDRITGVIKRQVSLMVRLIDDLLDVSRITHGTLELRVERTSLLALVNQAIDAAQPWIQRKRHTVLVEAVSGVVEVEGDAVRLVQVFTNILSNACKYTDPGGRVEVHITRDGGAAQVEFRDNGIGIPADKLDTIFEMFSQLDAPGRGDGGLGIGLTLSRRLVEMHGGSMIAASEGPGRGSQFTVRIPAVPARELESELPLGADDLDLDAAHDQQARRVLVVDDNVDAADTLAILLSARGHATRTAYDGTTALAEVATFRPEVLLLDLGLPDINGADVCKAIRAEPWGKRMLVVALSGWGQERDKRRTAEAGFDAHLTKPANIGELTHLLANTSPAPD